MASAAQIRAARENGRKSRGPKTPEGKRKSSANSRKHGLFAKNLQPDETCELLYQHLRVSLPVEFQPADDCERELVETIALTEARRQWTVRAQSAILTAECEKDQETQDPGFRAQLADMRASAPLERLARLYFRFGRQNHTARELLRKSQKRRERTEREARRRDALAAKNQKTAKRTESAPSANPPASPVKHTRRRCTPGRPGQFTLRRPMTAPNLQKTRNEPKPAVPLRHFHRPRHRRRWSESTPIASPVDRRTTVNPVGIIVTLKGHPDRLGLRTGVWNP